MDHGIVLHEIGHALGFAHEQSRPDRDLYVNILKDNIQETYLPNFNKEAEKFINFQGSEYDYSSIMHYGQSDFATSGCVGDACVTIQLNNETAYDKQERPVIGQRSYLSPHDILQIIRLYNCPGEGKDGVLMVRIGQGINIKIGNPYVQIDAVDSNGIVFNHTTKTKSATENPTWNEFAFFHYSNWQMFRISIENNAIPEERSHSCTYPIYGNPRSSVDNKYCANVACDSYVTYDYSLIEIQAGVLLVTVKNAENIPSEDGILPNPYVTVSAVSAYGLDPDTEQTTSVITGNTSPTWDESLEFNDRCNSGGFIVQIWNKHETSDDTPLSEPEFVELGCESGTRKVCFSDPCLYFIIVSFNLKYVELCIFPRTLSVYIESGHDLIKAKGNNTMFVLITAYKIDGSTIQKQTKRVKRSNPRWNEEIGFGENDWTKFELSLWVHFPDENINIRMSDDQIWVVSYHGGVFNDGYNILYAYYGYVRFSY